MRLTPEQRIRYDELEAESTKALREQAKAQAKTRVASAGQTTAGDIIETKHTKHGHDLSWCNWLSASAARTTTP